jgi:uncharacterized protein YjlB
MIKVRKIPAEILTVKVEQHKKYKLKLLDAIAELPFNNYHGDGIEDKDLATSDWGLPKNHPRKYLDLYYKDVIPSTMAQIQKYYKAQGWTITNSWYKTYNKNSYYPWHNHPETNFSLVYFLELPDSEFRTTVKVQDKIIEYEAKEGDLICFPAHLLHKAAANKSGRKTVIVSNANIHYGNQ